jgi:hypothetical protein
VEGLKAEVEAFWRGDYAAPFMAKDAEAYAAAPSPNGPTWCFIAPR